MKKTILVGLFLSSSLLAFESGSYKCDQITFDLESNGDAMAHGNPKSYMGSWDNKGDIAEIDTAIGVYSLIKDNGYTLYQEGSMAVPCQKKK